MTAPLTLPRADVQVADDGSVSITVDGAPWLDDGGRLTRTDLPQAVSRIVRERDTPVRFDVTDAGRTYTDIVTPAQMAAVAEPVPRTLGDVLGTGFAPGESVQVAIIVTTTTAGSDGTVVMRLPPALQRAVAASVVLIDATGRAAPAANDPSPGRGLTSPVTAANQSTPHRRPPASADPVLDGPAESSL